MKNLFTTYKLGKYELKNRFVMCPLTRSRAGKGYVPTDLNVLYYEQRATAGLIVSEGSQISQQGQGYTDTPGIYSEEQINGWKKVTDAVHKNNSRMFCQLWHCGRASHSIFQKNEELPVAPSAIPIKGSVYTHKGMLPYETPRALETSEIPLIVQQFRDAASNALKAGFDGVEVHGANSYLIDQFLQDETNQRTDKYGGSFENRTRFLNEVIEATASVFGYDRVGLRLTPGGRFNGIRDSKEKELFSYVVSQLNQFNLGYLHLVDPTIQPNEESNELTPKFFRPLYKGTLITAGGLTKEKANTLISNGDTDLAAFGRLFLSNPDLPYRFQNNLKLNDIDYTTFYGGDKKGYTDYPFAN